MPVYRRKEVSFNTAYSSLLANCSCECQLKRHKAKIVGPNLKNDETLIS